MNTGTSMNGGQALIKALEMEGVEVIFGLPGGAILPVYDPIIDSPIRHILVRHEQGAGHMAEGYAHATGRPGVAMVTSGPAATNIVTPLCDAYMDSIPMVVHHRPGARRRRSAPTPSRSATRPASRSRSPSTTSWSPTAQDIPRIVREAFHIATTGRPGPVLVDVPEGHRRPEEPELGHGVVLADDATWTTLPGYQPRHDGRPGDDPQGGRADPGQPSGRSSTPAAASSRPGPPSALRELAELTDIHVVTTLMARGAFPDDHPLASGMPGMHGNYTAVTVDAAAATC